MITKEYLREELRRRIESIKPGVKTKTDNTILEMKSILVLVDALPDYEKRYNEALEVMRQWIAPCHTKKQLDVMKESVFPELRESEDERIRKYLIDELKVAKSVGELKYIIPQPTREECIAYLENQKEQKHYWKPTETDVALFNKAVTTNKTLTPTERAQLDIIRSKFGYCRAVNCSGIVQKEQKPTLSEKEMKVLNSIIDDYEKAAKSFCGYDGKIGLLKAIRDGKYDLSKPKWNEEDENIRKQLISICDEWLGGGYSARPCLNDVRWLKNLLENQKELTPAKWSKEDKDYYDTIVHKLEVIGDDSGLSSNQIKFLREHCPLHRSEWSEEDETIIEGACSVLEVYGHTKLASMLRSLRTQPKQGLILTEEQEKKFGHLFSRPSWKPSKEQMIALNKVVNGEVLLTTQHRSLESLYEQLKKL